MCNFSSALFIFVCCSVLIIIQFQYNTIKVYFAFQMQNFFLHYQSMFCFYTYHNHHNNTRSCNFCLLRCLSLYGTCDISLNPYGTYDIRLSPLCLQHQIKILVGSIFIKVSLATFASSITTCSYKKVLLVVIQGNESFLHS